MCARYSFLKDGMQTTHMQMCGRAGRPQYDVEGKVVILTDKRNEAKYRVALTLPRVVSHFWPTATVRLLAEIVRGSIPTALDALRWIGLTFLACDVREAPAVYGLQSADAARDTLKALVKDAITTLLNNELIELGCGSATSIFKFHRNISMHFEFE